MDDCLVLISYLSSHGNCGNARVLGSSYLRQLCMQPGSHMICLCLNDVDKSAKALHQVFAIRTSAIDLSHQTVPESILWIKMR